MNGTYIQFGDGFEFILARNIAHVQQQIKFAADAIYDLDEQKWAKYRNIFHDDECIRYQFRSMEESERRKSFADVPVIDYETLHKLGYMIFLGHSETNPVSYRLDTREYAKRRRLFIEKTKLLPTTINLGVDEEMREINKAYEERDRQAQLQAEQEVQDRNIQ